MDSVPFQQLRPEERCSDQPISGVPVSAEPRAGLPGLLNVSAPMRWLWLFAETYSNISLIPGSLAVLLNPQIPLVYHSSSSGVPTREQAPSFANRGMSGRCFCSPVPQLSARAGWKRERPGEIGPVGSASSPAALARGGSAMGIESILHYSQRGEGSRGSRGAGRKMEELKGCSGVCTTFTKRV